SESALFLRADGPPVARMEQTGVSNHAGSLRSSAQRHRDQPDFRPARRAAPGPRVRHVSRDAAPPVSGRAQRRPALRAHESVQGSRKTVREAARSKGAAANPELLSGYGREPRTRSAQLPDARRLAAGFFQLCAIPARVAPERPSATAHRKTCRQTGRRRFFRLTQAHAGTIQCGTLTNSRIQATYGERAIWKCRPAG